MNKRLIPSRIIESKAERRMRLSFQKEKVVSLKTRITPTGKTYNRKKEKRNLSFALNVL